MTVPKENVVFVLTLYMHVSRRVRVNTLHFSIQYSVWCSLDFINTQNMHLMSFSKLIHTYIYIYIHTYIQTSIQFYLFIS